jgi:hypothetical protein
LLAVGIADFRELALIPGAAAETEEGSPVAGDLATRTFCAMPNLQKLSVMAEIVAKA